jgi:hypothetical protein
MLTRHLDDDKFTAHAGLLGTNVGSIKHPQINVQKSTAFVKSPATVAKFIKGSSAQQCYKRLDHCVKYDDTEALRNGCRSGETIVGLVQNPGCKVRMKLSAVGTPPCCQLMQFRKVKTTRYAVQHKALQSIVSGEEARAARLTAMANAMQEKSRYLVIRGAASCASLVRIQPSVTEASKFSAVKLHYGMRSRTIADGPKRRSKLGECCSVC